MNYDIESKLNMIKTEPMTETEKNTMWQKIEMRMNVKPFFSFSAFQFHFRAGIAFLLAVLFAGSGVAFAYADTAKPGDILFPLGVAREKVEIFLAPQSKKNELRVKFAEKRIEDGQVFLSLLVNAKGTLAATFAGSAATSTTSGTTSATTTATTTPPATATSTATTTPNSATEDATRHFNATIAYLQGVRAELLKNGGVVAANAIQRAIDAMIAQAREVPTDRSSVLVKIKNNANKFKMDIRIANGTTTERIAFEEKNKERKRGKKDGHDDDKDDDRRNGTTTTVVKETIITKFFHTEEKDERRGKQKKDEHDDDDDHRGRKHGDKHDDDNDGDEHEGFFDLFGKKATICHISGNDKQTISVGKKAVRAHLAHGDSLGACVNGTATTTPDTITPIISNVVAHPTATIAEITWNTNEPATGKVAYGTTTPLANVLGNTALSLSHSFNLTGLTASSTYHYIVSSADGAGNATSSAELTFTTM